MKCIIPYSAISNETQFLRHAGYSFHLDRKAGVESWVRLLGAHDYPRFHVYPEPRGKMLQLNLHLDQRKPVYKAKGVHAHAGEYDGPLVEEEVARLKALANVMAHSKAFEVPETPGIRVIRPVARSSFGTDFAAESPAAPAPDPAPVRRTRSEPSKKGFLERLFG